jgi:hypothetical protein
MKGSILLACIVGLLSATATAKAKPRPAPLSNYNNVIEQFIDSHLNTSYKEFDAVMDDAATIRVPRGETVMIEKKKDVVKQMKYLGIVKQDCTAKYEVLEKSGALVIARVDFKYQNAVQHHYLTLEKNEYKEWQIMQVCEIIDNIEQPAVKERQTPKRDIIAKN